ncbi:MAG: hypothetical protein NTW48_10350, partial [Chloroflexi bacterium]|nr:hypothetical protein [Chloroflexota bacterium]
KSGQVFEQKVDEVYAADAGVEDAMWYIRNDRIADVLGAGYDKYNYSSAYPYPYNLLVNDKDVVVNITNAWIPMITPTPDAAKARQIIEYGNLTIIGYPSSNTSTYVIKIVYDWDTAAHRDALRVMTIGIWISPGFEYVDGSCSLTGYSSQNISPYKGGSAVVWNFTSPFPRLRDFPALTDDTASPLIETFTFQYTGPQGQIPELVSSWINTTGVTGITYSWDDSIRLYKIVSQAGAVQVEAYGAQTKFRKLKSTISSDYAVAGNTLLTTLSGDWETYRDKLLAESQSTITRTSLQSIPPSGIVPAGKIPEEATIDKVYLYWSGWIDPYYWYKSGYSYYWAQIPALQHSQNTKAQLIANSQVNQVKFNVDSATQTITANISGVHSGGVPDIQIVNTPDAAYPSKNSDSWDYSCFKDITNLVISGNVTVQQYIENAMKTAGSGKVDFTLGHANEVRNQHRPESSPYPGAYDNYYFSLSGDGSTGYPLATPAHQKPNEGWQIRYQWAYAGWSLIIFYRSPALIQRQLYLYDDLINVQYPGGSSSDVTRYIGGFLAPPVISENDKSHVTYFVGEGDQLSVNSKVGVNNNPPTYHWLSELPLNPEGDVLNSMSSGLPVTRTDGVDIDTFVLPSGCILPYATSATITLHTTQETYTLVYFVLSFRSELTTGGIITNFQVRIS